MDGECVSQAAPQPIIRAPDNPEPPASRRDATRGDRKSERTEAMTTFYVPIENVSLPADDPTRWHMLVVEETSPVDAMMLGTAYAKALPVASGNQM